MRLNPIRQAQRTTVQTPETPTHEETQMDIIVGLFALVIAVGCVIAIVMASRKDSKAEKGC